MDDIPEVVRKPSPSKTTKFNTPLLLGIGFLTLCIAGLIAWGVGKMTASQPQKPVAVNPSPTPSVSPSVTPSPLENILGHLPYKEATLSQLKPITADGSIKMRASAAEEFLKMQKAAKRAGIILYPISGFRSLEAQKHLFFDVKAQRNQETKKRAEVSAPPGYSEHHTGYAVDIGDGRVPGTNLKVAFENTAAYRWLKDNAAQYSFELSFPPENPQGVSYEPWHWRYVGDSDSLETFYKAQQLRKQK
ncbi:MAG: hypothetical protein N5P05_002433 [Chroococcopsis gigantea SAG 12.99]|jgi:D-alanyl-D-alanine carboxypeptidase|nr:hypothetical protein [Chroococcopsis gigantea SAG 12.99]